MVRNQHDSALQRLGAALDEQDRSNEEFDASIGTPSEPGAYAGVCAAREDVSTRLAWLHWVDDGGYRGLHAGPFSLRTENRAGTRAPVSEGPTGLGTAASRG
jgi:hypothetical protein